MTDIMEKIAKADPKAKQILGLLAITLSSASLLIILLHGIPCGP